MTEFADKPYWLVLARLGGGGRGFSLSIAFNRIKLVSSFPFEEQRGKKFGEYEWLVGGDLLNTN